MAYKWKYTRGSTPGGLECMEGLLKHFFAIHNDTKLPLWQWIFEFGQWCAEEYHEPRCVEGEPGMEITYTVTGSEISPEPEPLGCNIDECID